MFIKGQGDSPVEELVAGAQRCIASDLLERAMASNGYDRAVVVTSTRSLAQRFCRLATVSVSQQPFHWGRQLVHTINSQGILQPFYISGGSLPLLTSATLGRAARTLAEGDECLVTNNLYSSDLVGFKPISALGRIELPATDNALAHRLHWHAGLHSYTLARTAATQFDIDTPTDLLVLKLHGGAGPSTQACVDGLDLDTSRLAQAVDLLSEPKKEVVVAGRVGSHVWRALERGTFCRVRFLSEERGLRSHGRDEGGEARSILGFYLEKVGVKEFFKALAEMGNAAFLDTRVIFAHLRLKVSQEDRFLSDLGWVDKIKHPVVKEFTRAALEAPIPVVLGGHSLVSGGMLALVDVAKRDIRRKTREILAHRKDDPFE
jgi:2-phospho-L-lactate guanylyltransferase (CobY/MobA/RfbA family)